ncbi:type III secretion system export apparatus subunit SctU [Burkholderia sp. FERM BP-3421]|jgi:type III secretion protein U|uniref:type III secretion system export apparatus subunit SctU n=1 Tax=Burkholderia sp. FERM BP-3421 TaxID=1494466 RepID=UPI00235E07DB|nr:type III secretion system export apparatus subunit SctU [Burkholderia sp. FERM BP-3421]WDD92582.1 type III secretion system export apparatus subunit SctU [Burkholderia sp. FERM BP-3421]
MADAEEKTEEPSEQKLRKAREKGQVAKSKDIADVATLAMVIGVLSTGEAMLGGGLEHLMRTALDFVASERSPQAALATLYALAGDAVWLTLPFAAGAILAGIGSQAPQAGFMITLEPVMPKLDSISPMAGLKRIFSLKALLELAKTIVKAVVLLCVVWKVVVGLFPLVAASIYEPAPQLSRVLWTLLMKLLGVVLMVIAVLAAADYKIAKIMFIRQNRMGKEEMKREMKESDGDPHTKGERRRLAREFATTPGPRQRMGQANVLVVNPTHYAVALRYAPDEHPLPRVIAKALDAGALALRREAHALGVPIVGNPPVARALYRVECDDAIPDALFETVAAILRWVEAVAGARDADPASVSPDARPA